jgi:hypothetical protein
MKCVTGLAVDSMAGRELHVLTSALGQAVAATGEVVKAATTASAVTGSENIGKS